MKRIRALVDAFVDFLFPRAEEVQRLLELSPGEMVRAFPAPKDTKDENILAIFSYEHELVRHMIWELKYRGNRALAKTIAQVSYDVLAHEIAERSLAENFGARGILLIPIPNSSKRMQERGYNQTEILGEELSLLDTEHLFIYSPHILKKISHTGSQTELHSKKDRLENLQSSMSVSDQALVQGRSIIILDDVTTTGATFAEAKRALKEAGAKKILCLAIAH